MVTNHLKEVIERLFHGAQNLEPTDSMDRKSIDREKYELSDDEQQAIYQCNNAARNGDFAPEDEMDEFYRLCRERCAVGLVLRSASPNGLDNVANQILSDLFSVAQRSRKITYRIFRTFRIGGFF